MVRVTAAVALVLSACSFAPAQLTPAPAAPDAAAPDADAAEARDDAAAPPDALPSLADAAPDGGVLEDDAATPDAGGFPDARPAPDAAMGFADASSALPYAPSNLEPADVDPVATTDRAIDVGAGATCTIDTTGAGSLTGSCGGSSANSLRVVTTRRGVPVMAATLEHMTIDRGTLRLIGDKAIIFLVRRDVRIEEGEIDGRGHGSTPGVGVVLACGSAKGEPGRSAGSGGGGGGGSFAMSAGTPGRASGLGSINAPGGRAGNIPGPSLDSFHAGCSGGSGGNGVSISGIDGMGGRGGGAGGAIQISAGELLEIDGRLTDKASVLAGGGGGEGGRSRGGGGGGGGSGGVIILEAGELVLRDHSVVSVIGGAGGEGGSGAPNGPNGNDGADGIAGGGSAGGIGGTTTGGNGGNGASGTSPSTLGEEGAPPGVPVDNVLGGGGGGGGAGTGRIRLRGLICAIDRGTEIAGLADVLCPP